MARVLRWQARACNAVRGRIDRDFRALSSLERWKTTLAAGLTRATGPASVRPVPAEEPTPSPALTSPTAITNSVWKHAPRVVASLLIAGGFVWLFHRGGLPLIPPPGTLATLSVWAVPAYALFTALNIYFRVHRWVPLLRSIAPGVSPIRVVGIGFVGIAAIMFAPLRMGEAARPYLLARDREVSFFQALGAAGAERVVDGFVLTLVAAIAVTFSVPLSPLPDHLGTMPLPVSIIPHAIYAAALVFSAAFVALCLFYGARAFAHRITHTLLSPISPKLASFVTSTLERLADGLKVLGSPKNRVAFFVETLLYWACNFGAQWALMRGCGIQGGLAR